MAAGGPQRRGACRARSSGQGWAWSPDPGGWPGACRARGAALAAGRGLPQGHGQASEEATRPGGPRSFCSAALRGGGQGEGDGGRHSPALTRKPPSVRKSVRDFKQRRSPGSGTEHKGTQHRGPHQRGATRPEDARVAIPAQPGHLVQMVKPQMVQNTHTHTPGGRLTGRRTQCTLN